MSKNTELAVGFPLVAVIALFAGVLMTYNPSPTSAEYNTIHPARHWWRTHFKSVIAGIMAYGFYVGAALMADAKFPEFLRDHLFDGLAPAALVAILVEIYPRGDPTRAFGRIRRPITMVLVVFFIPGAIVFGLIGMAAVFTSGANDYALPVIFTALWGGFALPCSYMSQVLAPDDDTSIGDTHWSRTTWWFRKRPSVEQPSEVTEQPASGAVPAVDKPAP